MGNLWVWVVSPSIFVYHSIYIRRGGDWNIFGESIIWLLIITLLKLSVLVVRIHLYFLTN